MTKRFGFTLAEVLITLGIIGVVAAMTIPTLMNQSSQAVFRTGFKKMMSVLNQAITMNVALEDSDFSALTSGSTAGSVYYMLASRMNTIKTTVGTTDMGATGPFTANYVLYLSDGMTIALDTAKNNSCSQFVSGDCSIVVDVNGIKGPNTLSTATDTTGSLTDQYVMEIFNQQVLPINRAGQYALYGK